MTDEQWLAVDEAISYLNQALASLSHAGEEAVDWYIDIEYVLNDMVEAVDG